MKAVSVINDVFNSIGVHLNLAEDIEVHKGSIEMLSLIDEARNEWVAARNYFDNVSDPDLIDHAVYVTQAAEKRYMYLLKQARDQGVCSQFPMRIYE